MTNLVTYALDGDVATLTMDDGKANALSYSMLKELHASFDRAEADGAVAVLTGRRDVFSAGLHLPTLRGGGPDADTMLRSAFDLVVRMITFPTPVVIACTGHAMAHGSFLLLCADDRLGAAGPYKISANEVAIGLVMPRSVIEICRYRLNPSHLHRALALAETYSPERAVEAGFLDRAVPPADLLSIALESARTYAKFDRKAFGGTRKRLREDMLPRLNAMIDKEYPRA
jgi:enoyl-CoA hydratase